MKTRGVRPYCSYRYQVDGREFPFEARCQNSNDIEVLYLPSAPTEAIKRRNLRFLVALQLMIASAAAVSLVGLFPRLKRLS